MKHSSHHNEVALTGCKYVIIMTNITNILCDC